ncbi:hypothetical protein AGMMS50249_1580 [candidate division SR1 bacterium]|nr:hypothetical protein AGMMS50249_1580 [candidate division SR1 bacterium]
MQLSLANKYRPQTFREMIGQQHIIGILEAKMQSESDFMQNYLLTGPRGTGKTTSARILAKAINCLEPIEGNPCNKCANCMAINGSTTLDYVEIDAASHTGVDNIREEILDKALYPPTMLKKKIYVIDEVHMLSKGAFNSLLKTIEEPKGNVCFILATTEIQKVPDTIISRCQVFQFKKVIESEIADHLAEICEKEGFEFQKDALDLIAMISDGGVRDSIKYLDQVSILGKITSENVSKFLGVLSENNVKNFLIIIKTGDKKQIYDAIDQFSQQGIDLFQLAKQVIGIIDKSILEDTDFYLFLSEKFSNILRQIRYYPYPAVLFKMELSPLNSQTSTLTSIPSPSQISTANIQPVSVSSKPVETAILADIQSIPSYEEGQDVWQRVVLSLNEGMLRSNLRDHTILDKLENGVAHLIITNKIAEISLQKAETRSDLEKKLSEIVGEKVILERKFESREDYLARSLDF